MIRSGSAPKGDNTQIGVTNSNKTISTDQIGCDGSLRVTLSLTAAPDIVANPTDIVLVLDRSGSMRGTPLADMKAGAKTFIDIIDKATDGYQDGQIGGGSHIGIVSFADSATADTQLITSVDTLKTAVDSLVAGGNTDHKDAFVKAAGLFDPASTNAKVIVMFTDGNTTAGGPAAPAADTAKAQGMIIYCIGLVGSDGLDVNMLNLWATDPAAAHVAVTPDSADLEELFAELAANISKTGATDIAIDEVIYPDFEITDVTVPDKGSVSRTDDQTLRWTIPELGVSASESAILEFTIRHVAVTQGTKKVNQSISYSDNENNVVSFPDPEVTVQCDIVVDPEGCPEPADLSVEACSDSVVVDMGHVQLQSLGHIIQVDVTIKDVCPGKRVALAAILTEVDENGEEYQRGMKAFAIPAHDYPSCRDVLVKCIKFVVPEDLDDVPGAGQAICRRRNFKVRFIAHNIDTDYRCCESVVTVMLGRS